MKRCVYVQCEGPHVRHVVSVLLACAKASTHPNKRLEYMPAGVWDLFFAS